jgi:ADP-heptose:LPS heptosyltransferase
MAVSLLKRIHNWLQRTPGLRALDALLVTVWFKGVIAVWLEICRSALWLRFIGVAVVNRKRLVIIARYGAIGDIICTFPAVAELVRQNPACRVVYVTRRSFKVLVERSGLDVTAMAARNDLVLPSRPVRVFKLSERLYHPGEHWGAKPVAIGMIDGYARFLGFASATGQPKLHVARAKAQALRANYLGQSGKPLVLLHAGPTWAVKEWPVESWARLVEKLRSELGCQVLQIAVARNITVIDPVCLMIPGADPIDCADDVDELLHLVAAVDLLVGVDSGPIHIAGAVGTPCVALFGPTDPKWILSNSKQVSPVFHRVDCSFCHHQYPRLHWLSGCPHDIKCMKELSVEEVFEVVVKKLQGPPAKSPQ